MATLGADLELGDIKAHNGSVLCCGWHDEEILFCASSAADLEREVLDGSDTLLVVCAAEGDAVRSAVEIAADGAVLVAVDTGSDIDVYRCRNYADGFSLAT